MNVRSRTITPRPTTTPAALSLRSSTAGWYAEWKARKQTPAAGSEQGTPPADERAEALARWLTGSEN